MANSYHDFMKMRKKDLVYKLLACQVTLDSQIMMLEQLLATREPVPVLDIVALTQDIEQVLRYSPVADKAEALATMICKRGSAV